MKRTDRILGIMMISLILASACKKENETIYTLVGSDLPSLHKQYNLAVRSVQPCKEMRKSF